MSRTSNDSGLDKGLSLQAWVDGQLSPEGQAAFNKALDKNPHLWSLALSYRRQSDQVRAAMAQFNWQDLPAHLTANGVRGGLRRWDRRQRHLKAMILSALVLGGVGGALVSQKVARRDELFEDDGFPHEAAVAHLTYVVDSKRPVEIAASDPSGLTRWLSRRLGKPLAPPDLSRTGFHLIGGRLLPADVGPAAQFMYQDAQGARLTVYLRSDPKRQETAFEFSRVVGLTGFRWVDQGFGYAIFADVSRDRLHTAALEVYRQTSPL